jgi:hypothetical protein
MTVSRQLPSASIREFLLGTLSEAERDRLEQDLLADDDLYELFRATEEDLIDECINNSLSGEQAESFLRYLTALPGGRDRVDFAQGLKTVLARSPQETKTRRLEVLRRSVSWLSVPERLAWSAALLSVAAAGIWSATNLPEERTRISELEAALERSSAEREELKSQLSVAAATEESTSAIRPPVVLTARLVRGVSEMETVTLSRGERLLELRLDLGSRDYEEYRAVLHDAESRELYAASQLTATVAEERIFVAFGVPAARLTNADYYVTLDGIVEPARREPVGTYSLRIIVR